MDQLIDLSPVKRLKEIAKIEVFGGLITVLLKNGELLEFEVEMADEPTDATYTVKRGYKAKQQEEDDDIRPQYLDHDPFD